MKQPKLAQKQNFDAGGFEKTKKNGGRGSVVHDGDWKRSTLKKEFSSISDSSESENDQIKEEIKF